VISKNAELLERRFRNVDRIQVQLSDSNPILTEDSVIQSLAKVFGQGKRSVLVDITTFTREALLILLNRLRNFRTNINRVYLVYTSAREYSIGNPRAKMWLSQGVREVRSVLGFPGKMMPSQRSHLIVLLGFEADRASQLIERYEPSILSVGHSPESTSVCKEHHLANKYFYRKLMAVHPRVQEFVFSAKDPFAVQRNIEEQIAKFSGTNVVVAGLNTKISTVGVALAAFKNPAIQIAYAQADLYNYARYSEAGKYYFLMEFSLH
jgi:hypothetical protein